MKISKYKLHSQNLDKLINYLKTQFQFSYENQSTDMSVLAAEKFYFRNNSTQLNLLILKVKNSIIEIDVIGGAGGSGLLNINLWSEKSFIKKAEKVLKTYSEENGLLFSEFSA
ncbi:MAG: DUF6054 family protein [bacterium]